MKGYVLASVVIIIIGFLPIAFASLMSGNWTRPTSLTSGKKPLMLAASGRRTFVFSPRNKSWVVYNSSGRAVKSGRASGGKGYCPDIGRSCRTPRGVFTVRWKGGSGCRSGRYPQPRGGAWMGWCIFFSKFYAIHASNNVPNYNASHGCIRVKPWAAKWLNSYLQPGDRVIVKSY